ncbi:MAG: NitT/TauT family transport system permease protein [Homoserinimonas sp.]|nr:NitT/TauT family transport system permease protein [Homoserinimonas sp.]
MRAAPAAGPRRSIVWGLRILFLVVVFGGWALANATGSISPIILPQLSAVLVQSVELLGEADVWIALAITAFEMIVGFGIAAVAGLLVGFVLSRKPLRSAIFEKLLAWGYIFPISLVYPLFLIWAGVGLPSKILFAAASAFFPIAYNTMRGLSAVPARYLKVGQAFGASAQATDWHIRAGAARPMILSGLRLGVSMATVSVVLAEMLGANAGLGFMAQQASSQFQIPQAYAVILILVVMTSLLLWFMETLLRDPNERLKK